MTPHPPAAALGEDPLPPHIRRHVEACPKCSRTHEQLREVREELRPVPSKGSEAMADRYGTPRPWGQRKGPNGEVFTVTDLALGKTVLLKRLHRGDRSRLFRVKQVLDARNHPHVAPILDLPPGEEAAYTRQQAHGRALADTDDAPPAAKTAWFRQIAAGLASLHSAGLAHGALHGHNVFITHEGQAVILDAGTGVLPDDHPCKAPELGRRGATPAADWYALGTLFADSPLASLAERMRRPSPEDRPDAMEVLSDLLAEDTTGTRARYSDLGKLGDGGMGEVLRVRDQMLDRVVALKRMRSGLVSDAAAVRQFGVEAQITAQLEHPGVIPVHELGQLSDGTPFFTMKRVQGQTLAAVLGQRDQPDGKSVVALIDVLIKVCDAVAYAHSRGVVHRDLTPKNLMVGDFGEVLVVDWGLAALVGDDGQRGGTRGYMPAEQESGEVCAPCQDVWALGAILREIAEDRGEPELVAIADKAQDEVPSRRYPSAFELAEELRAWRRGAEVGAYHYSAVERFARAVRPYQVPLGIGVLAVATVTVVAAIGGTQVVNAQRVARANLAQSLVERAQLALLAGDRVPAELYAAGAVALGDRPEARGVLSRLGRTPYPALVDELPWSCGSMAVDGGRVVCGRPEGAALAGGWDGGPVGRVWAGAPGEVLVETGDALVRLGAEDGAERGRIPLERPLVGAAWVGDQLVLADAGAVWAEGGEEAEVGRSEIVELARCGPDAVIWRTVHGNMPFHHWVPGQDARHLSITLRGGGAMACDEGGQRAAMVSGESVQVWNLGTQLQTADLSGHEGTIVDVAWSGTRVASASEDGTVRLWDPERWSTRPEVARLPGHDATGGLGTVRALAYAGPNLVVASAPALRRWNPELPGAVGTLDAVVGLQTVGWTASGDVVSFDRNGFWRRFDGQAGGNVATVRLGAVRPEALATDPSGARLAVGLPDGGLVVVDDRQHELWRATAHASEVRAVVWSPDGSRITTGSADGSVACWTADGQAVATWVAPGDDPVRALAVSPDGQAVAVLTEGGRMQVHDREGAPLGEPEVGIDAVVLANGGMALTAGRDGVVRYAGRPVLDERPLALAISADGAWMASAVDRVAAVRSTADGRERARLVAHARGASALAFAADGNTLASAGRDGKVVLWDLQSLHQPASAVARQVSARYGATLDGLDLRYGGTL